jgi:anaerobic magnesium-protoporphyrin IX monomethyl ester cyclase
MRVLLIWPNKDAFGFKPMGLSLLSALLKRRGDEVRLFDCTYIDLGHKSASEIRTGIRIFKPVDFSGYGMEKKEVDLTSELTRVLDDFRPEIVGVSALSDEVQAGLRASEIVKLWNPDVPVVWGGKAPTMAPEALLAHPEVDWVCVGEGIEFITDFAECIAVGRDPVGLSNVAFRDDHGTVHRNLLRPYYQDLDALPYLDWSIFDRRHFFKPYEGEVRVNGDHMMYWGCPSHCTYCINSAYRNLYGPKAGNFMRHYSPSRIVEELR